jgi:hypothetical protein
MTNIRTVEMLFLDDLFEMRGGYVLDFSDKTFTEFFKNELAIDIDSPAYAVAGGSKGKRLRCFLQTEGIPTVVRTLNALWEYREAHRIRSKKVDQITNAHGQLLAIINRLAGPSGRLPPTNVLPMSLVDIQRIDRIMADLIGLSSLAPHARGYAFEAFLKDLFDAYGLAAQDPFRLRGEQIDGSFQFGHETYLVEAKWQGKPVGVAELHTFHGKIEQKAAWTRGFFVSNSGFTDEGLAAFGRGKRVICMDGYDLYEMLNRKILFNNVLEQKIRRAAETGAPFARVRDLFPV